MAEEGTVIAVRPGEADIELARSEACASCGACAPDGRGMLMEGVPVDDGLRPGDRVRVEIAPQATARARTLLFVLPVVALVIGYLAGFLLSGVLRTPPDATGAAAALLACASTMAAVAIADRKRGGGRSGDVRVHAIISQVKPVTGDAALASNEEPPDEEDKIRE